MAQPKKEKKKEILPIPIFCCEKVLGDIYIYMNRDSYKYMSIMSFLCVREGTKTAICIHTYIHKYTQEQFIGN